jgi:hypothetical protein
MHEYSESEARTALATLIVKMNLETLARVASFVFDERSLFVSADGDRSARSGIYHRGQYITEVRSRGGES